MGLQFTSECYCGNDYGRHLIIDETDCNMNCAGDSSQTCGGFITNSIWRLYSKLRNHIF